MSIIHAAQALQYNYSWTLVVMQIVATVISPTVRYTNLFNIKIEICIRLCSYQTWSSSCETEGCYQCHQMSQVQWHRNYFYW